MSNSNSTKVCSRATCKRTLPLSSTTKTCDRCRELNKQSQKSGRVRLKEKETTLLLVTKENSTRNRSQIDLYTAKKHVKKQNAMAKPKMKVSLMEVGWISWNQPTK